MSLNTGSQMNFINALLHAGIGYVIRRKVWGERAYVMLENMELVWHTGRKATLLDADLAATLSADDIRAEDWEVI